MSVTGGRRGSDSHWPNDHITTLDSRQVHDDDHHLLVGERADFLTGLLWDFTVSISLLTTSSFGQLDPRHDNLIRQISPQKPCHRRKETRVLPRARSRKTRYGSRSPERYPPNLIFNVYSITDVRYEKREPPFSQTPPLRGSLPMEQ